MDFFPATSSPKTWPAAAAGESISVQGGRLWAIERSRSRPPEPLRVCLGFSNNDRLELVKDFLECTRTALPSRANWGSVVLEMSDPFPKCSDRSEERRRRKSTHWGESLRSHGLASGDTPPFRGEREDVLRIRESSLAPWLPWLESE